MLESETHASRKHGTCGSFGAFCTFSAKPFLLNKCYEIATWTKITVFERACLWNHNKHSGFSTFCKTVLWTMQISEAVNWTNMWEPSVSCRKESSQTPNRPKISRRHLNSPYNRRLESYRKRPQKYELRIFWVFQGVSEGVSWGISFWYVGGYFWISGLFEDEHRMQTAKHNDNSWYFWSTSCQTIIVTLTTPNLDIKLLSWLFVQARQKSRNLKEKGCFGKARQHDNKTRRDFERMSFLSWLLALEVEGFAPPPLPQHLPPLMLSCLCVCVLFFLSWVCVCVVGWLN